MVFALSTSPEAWASLSLAANFAQASSRVTAFTVGALASNAAAERAAKARVLRAFVMGNEVLAGWLGIV